LANKKQEHEPCIAVYKLVLPAGMTASLPHAEPAPVKMAANTK
jgi:hypothetical protein